MLQVAFCCTFLFLRLYWSFFVSLVLSALIYYYYLTITIISSIIIIIVLCSLLLLLFMIIFLGVLVATWRCSGRAELEQKNAWLQTPGKPLRGLDVIRCDAGCLGKVLREATFKGWLKHTVDVVGPCWGRSLVKTPALSHVEFSHWQVPISVQFLYLSLSTAFGWGITPPYIRSLGKNIFNNKTHPCLTWFTILLI